VFDKLAITKKRYKQEKIKIECCFFRKEEISLITVETPTVSFNGLSRVRIKTFPQYPREIIPMLVDSGFTLGEVNGEPVSFNEKGIMLRKVKTALEYNISIAGVVAIGDDGI
jgi:hypothetical protein